MNLVAKLMGFNRRRLRAARQRHKFEHLESRMLLAGDLPAILPLDSNGPSEPAALVSSVESILTTSQDAAAGKTATTDAPPTTKIAPALPAPQGVVVHVSNNSELQHAIVRRTSNMTIVLSPGEYLLSSTLIIKDVDNFTLRGATDDPNDVVLIGQGMKNSRYGNVPSGVWVGNASNTTLANMTIRDFYFHPIILNADAQSPHIYNMRLVDAGEQFLKSNPNGRGGGNNNGIVEYTQFEYTSTARSGYLGAIDVHTGDGWIIRDNVFRNIRAPAGVAGGTTIRMWNHSSNTLIESNAFFNCEYGIALGLDPNRPSDHSGGIVRNNFFHRNSNQKGDVAIIVNHSPGTQVLHNTIMLNGTYKNAIEYRFSDTTGTVIKNNLTDSAIQARDSAKGTVSGNVTNAVSDWFVDAAQGNLHLKASATAVIGQADVLAEARYDFDGQLRGMGGRTDIGADEYVPSQTPAPPIDVPPAAPVTTLYDFGTAKSPVASDAVQVAATHYDDAAGFGWISGNVHMFQRNATSAAPLLKDGHATAAGVFEVAMPNGSYDVELLLGDAFHARENMEVTLEGEVREVVSTSAGQVEAFRYRVDVHDGRLTIGLRSLSGGAAGIAGFRVTETAPSQVDPPPAPPIDVPPAAPVTTLYDFGTAKSPVASDAIQVAATHYDDVAGFGWISGSIHMFQRNATSAAPLLKDGHATTAGVFEVAVAIGSYDVELLLGDAFHARESMEVSLEGEVREVVSTSAGQVEAFRYRVVVHDGRLTIGLRSLSGGAAGIAGLRVTPAAS